jgi:disulfide bond formation protein DsbB
MTVNPFAWSFRVQFVFGLATCAALLLYAIYAQYDQFADPCPLCILQRVAFFAMGVVALIGALHNPKSPRGRKIYGVLAFLAAAIGAGIAARHVWLQHLPPDQVPACGPGLNYMLETMQSKFDFVKVLAKVLKGSGECAQINWTFLGFSMPEWTLLCFVLLGIGALAAGFRKR